MVQYNENGFPSRTRIISLEGLLCCVNDWHLVTAMGSSGKVPPCPVHSEPLEVLPLLLSSDAIFSLIAVQKLLIACIFYPRRIFIPLSALMVSAGTICFTLSSLFFCNLTAFYRDGSLQGCLFMNVFLKQNKASLPYLVSSHYRSMLKKTMLFSYS